MKRFIVEVDNTIAGLAHLKSLFDSSPDLIPVFDLDGVLLDASHRISLHADGSLDLDHYRANTTRENVMLDKCLPLAELPRYLSSRGRKYHVATARVLCSHSLELLTCRGIQAAYCMARDGDSDHRKDYQLKTDKLLSLFPDAKQRERLILLDDNRANCEAYAAAGALAIHVQAPWVLA